MITAMATPFHDDATPDLDGSQELASWLLDHGSDSLVAFGSTGEGATQSDGEKRDLLRAMKEAAGNRGKVIAGTGTYDTRHTIELTRMAEENGADAALVVTPYYNRPPQRGLIAHFTAVAQATSLPVILYNIPGRTACTIEADTLLRLAADVPNIVAVKDATADFQTASRVIAESPPEFEVYSGDDWATFPLVCMGAKGVISVAAHLAGERMREMIELAEAGDAAAARKIHDELMPLYRGLFIVSNPIPLKAALEMVGRPAGPPRLPLVPATDDERARIRQALVESGVLDS
ncbi:MAG TPA: 4-hydroxy-tetrahydrodipicolinate synthase [Actinomycetota bacterium]|nr:4-hydroxy-tetrahydrodipicolinate synthase [Actinomycetota bacterium]